MPYYPPNSGGGGGAVSSVNGKTGSVTLTKSDVGLGNANNTTDAEKPVSTATQTALDGKITSLNGVTGIWQGTQTEYDAIEDPDPNVLYVVVS